jgi:hypothetical protein
MLEKYLAHGIFFFCLFNTSLNVSDCIAPNDWMVVNSELQRMWKEAVMAQFEILSRNLLKGKVGELQKPQSG